MTVRQAGSLLLPKPDATSVSMAATSGVTYTGRKPIDVAILAPSSASPMNVFGPAEVFARANALFPTLAYCVRIVSAATTESPASFSGLPAVQSTYWELEQEVDTLLVAGGPFWQPPLRNPETLQLLDWLRVNCGHSRRYGSICTATMLLAEAGLLRHKRIAAHWKRQEEMETRYPDVRVLPDQIYVKDGSCYTAVGGSSAIDLALALVEEDYGSDVSLEIAKQMVLFARRSGIQPQLSATILSQASQVDSIRNLLVWMADNLDQDLSVSQLARRVAMSPRNFARHFGREVGKTPARHVSDLRLEAAKRNLAHARWSMEEVARASGFGSVEAFRRLFTRTFGISPGQYRERMEAAGASKPFAAISTFLKRSSLPQRQRSDSRISQ